MKPLVALAAAALMLSGCTTTTPPARNMSDLVDKDTRSLCRIALEDTDQSYRLAAAKLAVRRGADLQKCRSLIAADNSIMAGIVVAGAGIAVGAAAANNGYGGGYYPSAPAYGVAWDQFYNGYYQPIWRCRDRSTGRFVDSSYCYGKPMSDFTWPGWSA